MNLPFHFPFGSVSIATLVSGALGAIGVGGAGDAGHTAIVVAISGVCGGLIAIIPAIIKARTEARQVEGQQEETEHDRLIQRIYQFWELERTSWDKQQRSARARIERLEAILAILRGSKHAIAGECQYVVGWANLVQGICAKHDLDLPTFSFPDIIAINAREDLQIQKLCGVPDLDDPARQILPANPMASSA